MTCADVDRLLDAFVDAELPAPMLLAIARHAGGCPTCDAAVRDLTALHEAVERSAREEAESLDLARVWPAVVRGIERVETRRVWRRRLRVAPADALEVRITTVRATERGPSDAQLVALRPRLRRLVGYRSFQVVGEERRVCAWQTPAAFPIPGGRALHIVPKGMRDQAVVMQVKLLDGKRALVD